MSKNTFIADDNGDKKGFAEGRAEVKGLGAGLTAKYCDCTESTTNTSEIADWATAEEIGNLEALKADMLTKINACDATTKAALIAMLKAIKYVINDLKD